MGEAQRVIGRRPEVMSDAQFHLNRERGLDWTSFGPPAGAFRLLSQRFDHVGDALSVLSKLTPDSLLQTVVSIVSDYDAEGEAYYLTTTTIQTREMATAMMTNLRAQSGVPFNLVRPLRADEPSWSSDRVHDAH